MSFQSIVPLVTYTSDGVTLTYPIPDKFYDPADIKVFVTNLDGAEVQLPSGGVSFTVQIVLEDPTPPQRKSGNVVLNVNPGDDYRISVLIWPGSDQDQPFEGRPVTPRQNERVHDRHSMRDAAARQFLQRGFRATLDNPPGLRFIAIGAAGFVPMFDGLGNLIVGPGAADIAGAQAASAIAVEAAAFAVSATLRAYKSVATAAASIIPAITNTVLLAGYYTVSPGIGGGFWKRVAAAPASNVALAHFRSVDRFMPDGSLDLANGGWWALIPDDDGFVRPEQCGCPDTYAGAGDETFIQAAVHHSGGRVKFRGSQAGAGRYYYINAEIFVPYVNSILKTEGSIVYSWFFCESNVGRTFTFGSESQSCGSVVVEGLRFERSNFANWYMAGSNVVAIANATTGTITITANPIVTGQMFYVKGTGTQADNRKFKAGVVAGNTVFLLDPVTNAPINTTAWTPWVSGGTAHPYSTVGATDTAVGVDNQTPYGNSWHIRLYRPSLAEIRRCNFTGHGRQLWIDGNSYVLVDHCGFSGYWDIDRAGWQDCEANIWFSSTLERATAINGVTNQAQARVTSAGHILQNGDRIYIAGLAGAMGVALNGRYFTVANVSGSSFGLLDYPGGFSIDTTAIGAYTSGGTVREVNPGAALQTKGSITNCVFQSTGLQSSDPGFTNKTPIHNVTVGNATVAQREDIGSKYAVAVFNAEGLDIGPNNYAGGHGDSSFYFRNQPFAAPSSALTGHIKIFDNFLDGDRRHSITVDPGDALIYAFDVHDNTCNGGDVCDSIIRVEPSPLAPCTISHLTIHHNISQGHRRSPYVINDVHALVFDGNQVGAYNVLGNTDTDPSTWSGLFTNTDVKGVTLNGNIYGGGINDPDGANFCKTGSYVANLTGAKRGMENVYNFGLGGGVLSTVTGGF